MAKRYVPWTGRFSRSRSIATYLKRAIDADIITQQGEVEAVDSAQVEGIVQASAVDSAEVTNLISSDYIQARVDGTYIRDYIDQEYIRSLLDSDYISGLAGGGAAPTITTVSPTSYNGTSGTTITVNGSNFTVGTYVDFIDINGVEYRASSTTLVSQAQVTAVTPQGFSASVDPLSVKVTTSNGTTTASNVITTGSSPSWNTGTNLGSYAKNAPVNRTVVATDPQSQPVTYQVKAGSSLPTGLSLNSNTGVISGTLNYSISSNTTVSTIITASDTASNTTDRTFNWTITPTSSISMAWAFPLLGSKNLGPTSTETTNWMQANLSTNGNFDDMFSAYGTGAVNGARGIYWLRPNRKVRVDYRIKGASGGSNYYARSYGGGQGRDISGSFYCNSSNYIGFMVGRSGTRYYNSQYQYSAGGGGGASCIFVARSGYGTNAGSYWYPAAIAAGGGGIPGGGISTYWSDHDVWSALPLDYPYRTGDATGGRYDVYSRYSSSDFYSSGGAGWQYPSNGWSTSSDWYRTGAAAFRDSIYSGQSGTFWNVSTRTINSRQFTRAFGGFGGGGGTWFQNNNTSSNQSYSYHAHGGGGGGYYGGFPTSHSYEGTTSSLGYLRQYPFVSYVGVGHQGTATNTGSNNNYYGAYSFALGLESTGTYTQDGGSVAGNATSINYNGNTSYGAYWDSTLPRPTDHGVVNGLYNEGSVSVTISAA